MRVAVLGASDNPERYSNMAIKLLREHNHEALPVHPTLQTIDEIPVSASLRQVEPPIDVLTLYVSPQISTDLSHAILESKPQAIIFNPGTENPELASKARSKGIAAIEACTLVLLRTGQFDLEHFKQVSKSVRDAQKAAQAAAETPQQ